jgi:hypothetical protein
MKSIAKSPLGKDTDGMADERWKGRPRFIDGGGAAPGKVKHVGRDNTEQFECLRCDTKQIESKSARFRSSRIRCRHCGGAVYPVTPTPEKVVVVRKCKDCETRLRSTNTSRYCSVCGGR